MKVYLAAQVILGVFDRNALLTLEKTLVN